MWQKLNDNTLGESCSNNEAWQLDMKRAKLHLMIADSLKHPSCLSEKVTALVRAV